MRVLESLWARLWGTRPLESLPYEELLARYSKAPRAVYTEFCRRLHRTVFYAALDYAKRHAPADAEREANELTIRVFEAFAPQVASGEPATGLRRFAGVIRTLLDEEAFRMVARIYYRQLPLYHMENDEQRRVLAALFDDGLAVPSGTSMAESVAERFHMSVVRADVVIKMARQRLDRVIQEDFDPDELRSLTEDTLP